MALTALALLGVIGGTLRGLRNGWYLLHVAMVAGIAWLADQQHWLSAEPFSKQAFFYVIVIHLVTINLVTFLAYGWDKRAAYGGGWRIPEKTLHAFAFIGGTPAAFAGQKFFRHKTAKKKFRQMFIAVIILQIAALVAGYVYLTA